MAATKLRQGKMANSFGRPSLLALTVSIGMLGVTPSFAAEEMDHSGMDHSKMGHGSMQMDAAPSESMPAMDHSKMGLANIRNRLPLLITARWGMLKARANPARWTIARWTMEP